MDSLTENRVALARIKYQGNGNLKAQPLIKEGNEPSRPIREGETATHLALNIPGPSSYIILPVIQKGSRKKSGCWTWNGDTEKPTLKPSLLTKCGREGRIRCHSWVTDGNVQFLGDTTHDLKGQTVELLEMDMQW